ncbi:MAG: bifunctional 5,10-methylenetetrahydrofolate dehydrogenase/5,10-methenyltetrahydrofolate cyclohydrolase [Patescibacteria group bacterium]|nr:bifunctional 5,10-methylenetetrahydrofolate dehydrogenase/5,10-methenyltetrahydrofolate cyclohydrolase [Patescibacteria group bacterium]
MNIIDGKKIGEKIKTKIAKEVFSLIQAGERRPSLAIILAGDRSDSSLYVSLKEKSAKEVGIDTSLYLIKEDDSEEDFIKTIKFLNNDDSVDGILIQLPLPKKFNTEKILKKINPIKDVDGFCVDKPQEILSPVVLAIKESLASLKKDFKNKKAFLFYNSEIFRNEVKNFLEKENIFLESYCMKDSSEFDDKIIKKIKECEILITAVGKPRFIKKDFLFEGMTIIDIGISKEGEKVFGDVDFSDVKKLNINITPVPGGVGPMTVACVLKNTLIAYKLGNIKNK